MEKKTPAHQVAGGSFYPEFFARRHNSIFIGRGHEAGAMVIVASFPDNDYFVDRDVTTLPVSITQMQNTTFNLDYVTTQA